MLKNYAQKCTITVQNLNQFETRATMNFGQSWIERCGVNRESFRPGGDTVTARPGRAHAAAPPPGRLRQVGPAPRLQALRVQHRVTSPPRLHSESDSPGWAQAGSRLETAGRRRAAAGGLVNVAASEPHSQRRPVAAPSGSCPESLNKLRRRLGPTTVVVGPGAVSEDPQVRGGGRDEEELRQRGVCRMLDGINFAGCSDDRELSEIELICDLVLAYFPNTNFVRHLCHPCEWKYYRQMICDKYGFKHPGQSCLVWRRDGKLIGGQAEFKKLLEEKYRISCSPDIHSGMIQELFEENQRQMDGLVQTNGWTPFIGEFHKIWTERKESFEGRWLNHKPQRGTFIYADGSRYEGEFVDGRFEGKGKRTYHDGSEYSGSFHDGRRHGKGVYWDVDGNVYDGEFLEGVCQGIGTKTWVSGRTYRGEWKQNKASGLGEESFPQQGDFLFYAGEFVDGRWCGHGECHYPNGNVFKGAWKDNKREGRGVLSIFGHALRLEGTFENDVFIHGIIFFDKSSTPYPGEVQLNPQGVTDYFDSYEFKQDILHWFDLISHRAPRNLNRSQDLSLQKAFLSKYISEEDVANSLSSRISELGCQDHDCVLRIKDRCCIVVPDPGALLLFPEILVPAIKEQHSRFNPSSLLSTEKLDSASIKQFDFSEIQGVKRVVVKIYRNIDNFSFVSSIHLNELVKIEKLFLQFLESDEKCRGSYYPLASNDMPVDDKKWLFSGASRVSVLAGAQSMSRESAPEQVRLRLLLGMAESPWSVLERGEEDHCSREREGAPVLHVSLRSKSVQRLPRGPCRPHLSLRGVPQQQAASVCLAVRPCCPCS
eukprot:762781-Hanusia_phi.AAC.10